MPVVSHFVRGAALIVLHLGVLLVVWSGDELATAVTKQAWPVVTGQITHADVVDGPDYRPEYEYYYQVNGNEFTGRSILHAPAFGGKIKQYDVSVSLNEERLLDSNLAVHFNPVNPSESTITPDPSWSIYVRLAAGILLFMLGLFTVFLPRR